jgi:hypothetical protein
MAVLPKEGAYETTFYYKMRRFASQLMKPGVSAQNPSMSAMAILQQ